MHLRQVDDANNGCVRQVNLSSGIMSTLVGGAETSCADGVGTSAAFGSYSGLTGIAVDEKATFALVVSCVYVGGRLVRVKNSQCTVHLPHLPQLSLDGKR